MRELIETTFRKVRKAFFFVTARIWLAAEIVSCGMYGSFCLESTLLGKAILFTAAAIFLFGVISFAILGMWGWVAGLLSLPLVFFSAQYYFQEF